MKSLFFTLLCASSLCANGSAKYEKIQDRAQLNILSPVLAERQTVKLRLPNGLEAYLVSDPNVDQSAAALSVEAGSWNDPAAYPGMAHFLEHMLFMGTEAYPKEDEFMPFVKENGGKVNAYTAPDRTVYMFSVNNAGFNGALDRFSHFFIDPLFLPSSIERELLAVDQEHAKNIENDGWRQYMILKETGNQSHPNAKFSTGNADTLRGIPQDAMKKWYKEHYSADKMHLVIYSSLPIDELIDLTVQDFSAVPIHSTVEEKMPPKMTSEKQEGHFIYINPIKDLKVLSLTWELPADLARDQEAQVGQLLSYTLKTGSKNSLLGLLKREHLAEAVGVTQDQLGKDQKFFSIDIELTDKGIEELSTVINYAFESLARLKKTGIPRYIFDEVQKIATINYQYQSRKDSFDFVLQTAHTMVDESLETYPQKTLIPTEYNPTLISDYINALTPQSCIYFVIADPEKTKIPMTNKEKWMGAEYAIQAPSQQELLAWNNASINPQIGLPPPNQFIPKNLELVHKTASDEVIVPVLLQDNNHGKVFFAEDTHYLVPEISHVFRIKSPLLDGSARSKALADLYIKAIYDELFPLISTADAADSKISIRQDQLSLTIAINGYSDNSDKLTEEFMGGIRKIRPSKEQFNLYKESLLSSYENGDKELLFLQSMQLLSSVIFSDNPTYVEKTAALKNISYNDFVEFSKGVFKKAYFEALLYGNITKNDAESLLTGIHKKFKSVSYPVAEHHERKILLLPQGQGPYMVAQPTAMQGNAAILLIQQGAYSFEKRACQQVLGSVLQNAFFNTLRTKQQVAYIAKAWEKEEEKQLLQLFGVQSSTHQPNELIARFELFLENFVKQYTTEFPKERFENVRQMAIASLEMPPENLSRSSGRLFCLGFDYEGDFHMIEKRISALQKISYEQTREVANQTLSRSNSRRIAVLVEGVNPREKDFRYELISSKDLKDFGTFVTKRELPFLSTEGASKPALR